MVLVRCTFQEWADENCLETRIVTRLIPFLNLFMHIAASLLGVLNDLPEDHSDDGEEKHDTDDDADIHLRGFLMGLYQRKFRCVFIEGHGAYV